MKKDTFWDIVERCREEVKTWPKWMRETDLSQPHCADEDA